MAWNLLKRRATSPLDITAAIPDATGGRLLIWRDGGTVWMDFESLALGQTGDLILRDVIPPGCQPIKPFDIGVSRRIHTDASETQGTIRVYGSTLVIYRAAATVRGLVSWPTGDPMP